MRNIRNFDVDGSEPWYTRVGIALVALLHFVLWFVYALKDALAGDLGPDYGVGLALILGGAFALVGGFLFFGLVEYVPWSQAVAFAVLAYIFMGIVHHRFINR